MHILSSSTYSVVSPSPSQGPFKTVWTPWHIQVTEQPILGPTSLHSRNSPMCSLVLKLKFSTVKSVMSFLLKYWKAKHHLQHSPWPHTSLRWHMSIHRSTQSTITHKPMMTSNKTAIHFHLNTSGHEFHLMCSTRYTGTAKSTINTFWIIISIFTKIKREAVFQTTSVYLRLPDRHNCI